MKRSTIFISLVLLFSFLVGSISSLAQTKSPKILILGDSISSGYGLEGYPNKDFLNYGKIFAKSLGSDSPDKYVNLSIDGETTGGLLWRIENSDAELFSGFDAVILSSGGNDLIDSLLPSVISLISEFSKESYNDGDIFKKISLISESFFASAERTSEIVGRNLDLILSQIKENNSHAYTAVLSVYDPFDDKENNGAIKLIDQLLISPCIDIINTNIKNSAEKNGFDYIDVASIFKGNASHYTNIKSLDIHPNATGHLAIGEKITELYNKSASTDVFLETDNGYPAAENHVRRAFAIASIAGATLFGCAFVVISFGKFKVKLIQ